jgi:hypothetical protein
MRVNRNDNRTMTLLADDGTELGSLLPCDDGTGDYMFANADKSVTRRTHEISDLLKDDSTLKDEYLPGAGLGGTVG